MLFRRRKPAGIADKLRSLLWPAKGFMRPFHYFRMRVMRLSASPHAVAAGVAAGIASSWTPFIGLHLIVSVLLSYLVAGDLIAAALATTFGNPLTFPFIWAATWKIGTWMLGEGDPTIGHHLDLHHLFSNFGWADFWGPVIEPMLIGAVPPALLSGLIVYGLTFFVVRGFRRRRRLRLAEVARNRPVQAGAGI